MKLAIATTTINIPTAIPLLVSWKKTGVLGQDYDLRVFVAADHKTPEKAYEFCANLPEVEIYSPTQQTELEYACSELIGWNCVQRRNIALLEALAWGAEVLVL